MPKSYKKEHPEGDYDWIIIGSGISGLTLAAILAKEGKKCLILERHYTAGGYTHVFKRRDYEWDVGVHYIGEVHRENSMLRRFFDYITNEKLKWAEMGEVYDRIYFGKESFDFHKGTENFKENLKKQFPAPEDQKSIDEYVHLIRAAAYTARDLFMEKGLPSIASKVVGGFVNRKAKKYTKKTTREVMESITKNEKLIGVLCGQYGDYGLPPGQSSFFMHAMVAKHYLNGGAYPVGGSAQMFDTIEPIITEGGGEVFTNAGVVKIMVENNKAVGVEMEDGKQLRAKGVVSSVGVHNTFVHLLKDEPKVAKIAKKLKKVEASASHICLYVGFKKTAEELGFEKTNYWVYPENGYNHDETVKKFEQNPEENDFPVVYISFPSAKDPDWDNRYPGRSTVEILTVTDYKLFEKWEDKRWKKRGDEYKAYKEKLSQRLLEKMYEYLPQTKGQVDFYELSTPLSTKHFVNYEKGEIYGLEHTPSRFDETALRAHTPIKNFYLTGQDIVSCGIGGALIAGVITASLITKKDIIKKVIRDEA